MIQSVTVTNYLGESLTMDLRHPERTGIFIARIEGIGAPKAQINMAELSMDDGGLFTSSRAESRNILLTLGYLFEPTIEEVRHKVYKYFPIKKKLKLTITTDIRVSEIYGYVETNDPEIFTQQQATQISVLCPDPYFYSREVNTTVFSGVENVFEFPFENASIPNNMLTISTLHIETERTVLYPGDAEVGMQIHMHAIGPVQNLAIYNVNTRESMKINHAKLVAMTGSGIKAGDDILITTTRASKTITLLRAGEYYNILNVLDKNTDWFKLVKGDNVFVYTADSGDTNLQFHITNQIAYEGV